MASLSLPAPVVEPIRLAVCSVPVLSDLSVVHARAGALDAKLHISKEPISRLELQVALKAALIAAKVGHVDLLEQRVGKKKNGLC